MGFTRNQYVKLFDRYKGNLKKMSAAYKETDYSSEALGILGEKWGLIKGHEYRDKIIDLHTSESLSCSGIDHRVGLPNGTALYMLKAAGIRPKHAHTPKYMRTFEWLDEQYTKHQRPVNEIAVEMGCSTVEAYVWMRRSGVKLRHGSSSTTGRGPGRPRAEDAVAPKHKTEKWLRQEYHEKRRLVNDICAEMGCTPMIFYKYVRAAGLSLRSDIDAEAEGKKIAVAATASNKKR